MSKYLDTPDSDWYKPRITGLTFCILAAFFLLGIRLFHLQVIKGEGFRRLSENNCIRLQSISPSRGLIFDRNGSLLVDNRPSFNLSLVLKDANPVAETVFRLTEYIDLSESDFMAKIAQQNGEASYKPVRLMTDIERDTLAVVEAHKYELPGVVVDVKPIRHYIHSQSGAHILGYLSEINTEELKGGRYPGARSGDFIGKFGVEKTFEQFLKGTRGGRQVEVNASGQVVRVLKTVETRPGNNIRLTIDLELQKKAEELFRDRVGAIVAMDPSTGHILAMASSPSFDQNQFVGGMSHKEWGALIANPFRPMENKAIQGEYPPASTYKIVTAMAGLEEKVIDENTSFFCPGYLKYGDRSFRCWQKHGHGRVNVVQALAQSCDVFFYHVGLKLGVDRISRYAKACGLGSPTGIRLDHEAKGLVPTSSWKKHRFGIPWQGGETLSVAIGQGYNLVTPLQMVVLTSAIGNGGVRYTPLILQAVESADGEVVSGSEIKIAGKLPVSEKTIEIIRKGLWGVVNTKLGTAKNARIKGLEVSGKTGTAQLVSRKGDSEEEKKKPMRFRPQVWFVAYAPSVNPKIAVAVIIEHGEHGSSTAQPLAKKLIQCFLQHET